MRLLRLVSTWAVLAGAALAGVGCAWEEQVVNDPWAGLRRMENKPHLPTADPTINSETALQGYAILLERFEGDRRHAQARQLVSKLFTQAHVPDLWVRDTGKGLEVLRGRYPDPRHPAAENDLRQMRLVRVDDARPYGHVQLVNLADARPVGVAGVDPAKLHPFDLRRHIGRYSLQIGYYDDQLGSDRKKAAEEAVSVLRAEGHEAYFYHGQFRSLIALGVFGEEDVGVETHEAEDGSVIKVPVYGQRVRKLQEKFPYNLGNGLTMVEKVNGRSMGEQRSFLVKVK